MPQQQTQSQPDFIPADPDFIPAEESKTQPQESGAAHFLHSAGLPATPSEIMPAIKGMIHPEASKEHPGFGQTIPIIGPMLRAQRETYDQPDIAGKVYGSIPFVGPPGYRMGKQLEDKDWWGAAGSGLNIATQMLGLKPRAPAIARATEDIAAPVVRGTATGVNAALKRAPGAVGATVGSGVAHELGIPAWMGGAAGYGLGKELLPQVRIPGENFGAGPRPPKPSFFTPNSEKFLRSPGIEGETPPTPQVPTRETAWPPAAPRNVIQRAAHQTSKSELADRLETKEMQEQMRRDLEEHGHSAYSQEKRDWFARNQPGSTKGELTGQTPPVTNVPPVKVRIVNASGESPASAEALSRVASEKAGGIKRFRIDTRSGKEVPLVGVDAVDAVAGPYDRIVQRGPKGEVTLDEGLKARPVRSMKSGQDLVEGLKSMKAGK